MSNVKEIKQLVDHLSAALDSSELTEASITTENVKIRLKRDLPPVISYAAAPMASAAPVAAPPAATSSPAANAAAPSGSTEAPAASLTAGEVVKSPMVGTAYLSSEPGKPAFVSEGSAVTAGDTLLIIEAMKVMNTLTAPVSGTISEILVSDGAPLEFDQPLFVIS